jgi:Purple acid Phosphatase, N-terminal domain
MHISITSIGRPLSIAILSLVLVVGLRAQLTSAATATTTLQNVPAVSAILATSTATSAAVMWTTDQVSGSQVAYGTSTSYTATTTGPNLALNHSVLLNGLAPGTTYHFEIFSSNGMGTAVSMDQTFTTPSTPPQASTATSSAISNILVIPTDSTATVTWATDTPTSSEVLYGLTPEYTASTTGGNTIIPMTGSHAVSIVGLTSNTIYHFAIVSMSASDITATSTDQLFTTAAALGGD